MQRREKIMNKMIRRFLFALLLSFPLAAQAATPAELIRELGEADFTRKSEIAIELSKADAPAAVRLMDAMIVGTLYATADGKAVIDLGDGKGYVDALSGAAVTPDTSALNQIVANNRLRRELRGLSASLSLMSPDPAMRESAAEAAFSTHDAESLESVEKALAAEKDAGIRTILAQARANILLQSGAADEQQKLDSIALLVARGDQDSINALMVVANDESPRVRDASAKGVETIQSSLSYWAFTQNLIYGLSLGSVLLLAAIGLSITFGVMGVINMAHGEMIMLGAYTTYVVQQVITAYAPALMPFALPIAIPLAFLVSGGMGVVLERGIIRFLYGRPLETLLATWGVSLILQQAIRSIFGPTNKAVSSPAWMSGAFDLGHLTLTYSRLWIIVFALVVLAALMAFLKRTHFGLEMRAVTQNRRMASAMGVRTNWVDALTFGLGSGVAGIAGVALSQIDNVSPNLGQSYIIDSFMVVVFGGVGNLWGTLIGAGVLGVANKLLEPYAGAVIGKILVLLFIIFFMQKKPRGLFALKGRAVEA
jgi:urea transport system permease protein